MKVLVGLRSPEEPMTDLVGVELVPDSAIIPGGRPFFAPDMASAWDYYVGVGFRASRLGKCIDGRFAVRYFDAMALCVMPRASALLPGLEVASELRHSFDGAVITGEWIPLIPKDSSQPEVIVDGEVRQVDASWDSIASFLETTCRFGTLKMGDILIPSSTWFASDIAENHVVTGSIDGRECLRFKVK